MWPVLWRVCPYLNASLTFDLSSRWMDGHNQLLLSTVVNVFGIYVHVDTVVIVHVGGTWSALDFYTSHSKMQKCVYTHTLLCSSGNHWQCFGCFVTINNCIHDSWWCVACYKQIFYGCPAWSVITQNIFMQPDVFMCQQAGSHRLGCWLKAPPTFWRGSGTGGKPELYMFPNIPV